MDAYRFVVVYRSERPAAEGQPPVWRGWIEQVYPATDGGVERQWFRKVSEVSDLIAASLPVEDSGGSHAD